ncbi:MAG: hypothetical protein KAR42_09845 [candidate division Zixibacteria bacterium]|nr:hypothetical protein [candidate division Zixibacteria bacterium]
MTKCHKVLLLAFLLILCGAIFMGLTGERVEADKQALQGICEWNPGDAHKMHFPQLPDETGWDVNATAPNVLADDWRCSETGWVKDIHFWGSWKDGTIGDLTAFRVQIYTDIPVDPPSILYSRPGTLLWEREITDFEYVDFTTADFEGWYDPATGEVLWNNNQMYSQYNLCFEENDWFWQETGTIYWLCISAVVTDPQNTKWGWKSTQDHFNDDAVWAFEDQLNWIDLWEPVEPIVNEWNVEFAPGGMFAGGSGTGYYGEGWYEYESGWWNIWFYDHPFDDTRKKDIHIEFDAFPMDGQLPSFITVAVNWSTPEWSLVGNPPPDPRVPPLPPVDEAAYIGRAILLEGEYAPGHYIFDYTLPDFNPEWVSVDVMGDNVVVPPGTGIIDHRCMGSLDLAFVITNEGFIEEDEACCFPDGSCTDMLPVDCHAAGGTPQGPGTICTAPEACCLQDGSCVMADPICCDDLGGTSQGAGTSCTAVEACCMPDGTCSDLDPLCCADAGGTPQGVGTNCSAITIACCLPDGSCQTLDPLCCDDIGGTPSPIGATGCMGDNNGNLIDDACEVPTSDGACCLPDGSCTVTSASNCATMGGTFKGAGSNCFGDSNGNGIDDACEDPWQPGYGHKMHYPQLPDEAGWDVMAMFPSILADDWMCSESGPVKDFHFWGSWFNGNTGVINSFTIQIYTDVPADPPMTYSHPGLLLWEEDIYNFNSTLIIPETLEGWFNPATGLMIPDNHLEYWQYDVYLPEVDWFIQEVGSIYWLAITANIEESVATQWGWKSSVDHWNDDAVWKEWMIYCVGQDNGLGTVDLPPVPCPYISNDEVMEIIDGLPPGTTIEMDPQLDTYTNIVRAPGGSLGGEIENFDAMLLLNMVGTGDLTGFTRTVSLPLVMEFHQGPRINGDPIQHFPSLIWAMDGQIYGDPDFCTFHITAGEAFGLPCPGETKLKRLPDGTFQVDSFFDITYQIEFEGCPGSVLDGYAGTTTATLRMELSGPQTGDWFELYEPPAFEVSMDLSFVITNGVVEDTCSQQNLGDVNNDGAIGINDVTYLIAYLNMGGPPLPVPANADVNADCCIDMWDVVFLNAFLFAGGPAPDTCTCVNPPPCYCFVGDANNDAQVNVGDAVYIINYAFKGGPPPVPFAVCSGDANCDCTVNIGDAVFLINYAFKGGPQPCDCCTWTAACGAPHK